MQCFEQITARFGRKSTYLVIGDGYEEEMSAKQVCRAWTKASVYNLICIQAHWHT